MRASKQHAATGDVIMIETVHDRERRQGTNTSYIERTDEREILSVESKLNAIQRNGSLFLPTVSQRGVE